MIHLTPLVLIKTYTRSNVKNKISVLMIASFLTLLFVSCNAEVSTSKAKFEITNATNQVIDSLNISAYKLGLTDLYITLNPGETNEYEVDLSDLPLADGEYEISFKTNKSAIQSERFGYFTHRQSLEKLTKIEIQKDTLMINQIFDYGKTLK